MDFKEWGIQHLVSFFELNEKQIRYFSYNRGSRKLYKRFRIPKRNGWFRILSEPCKSLKGAQRKLLDEVLYNYDTLLSNTTIWFRKNKSIVDNAIIHRWKTYILKLDIQNFFPSISRDRVFWLFYRTFDFSYEISDLLAWICTYKNELPQGAPTSPMIANLIARKLDYRIIWLLQRLNEIDSTNSFNYSRYADDITISFCRSLNVNNLIDIIADIIQEEGFMLNPSKIRIISSNYNQNVTWITVNNKVSLWKNIHRKWRAILHNIQYKWWDSALAKWNSINNTDLGIEEFKMIISWFRNYFSMILAWSNQESTALKSILDSLNAL